MSGKKKELPRARDEETCDPRDPVCCDMRGFLSFLILFLLSKKPMHGQEIADELEKRKGERPSPGTIYPALKLLKENGFIDEQKQGKTIVYTLSADGKASLRLAKQKFARMFLGLME
jgi:DNA-binding PadR family transcriptional regulator